MRHSHTTWLGCIATPPPAHASSGLSHLHQAKGSDATNNLARHKTADASARLHQAQREHHMLGLALQSNVKLVVRCAAANNKR